MNFKQAVAIFVFLFVGANTASAASLYLDPQSGTYSEGSSFTLSVRVDNQGECINAGTILLSYPSDIVDAVTVIRGTSIFSLWPEEPVIDKENGTITFSGGLPGGYCGRIPGDPGLTNTLAEIVFRIPGTTIGARSSDEGEIGFEGGTIVLLNDGRGTEAELVTSNSLFSIVPPGEGEDTQDWFEVINSDTTKPEAFSVELYRDESVYEGKWFVIFNTLDKQTGIDHFEVYETTIGNEGAVTGKKDEVASWKDARSPYLLEDQSLNSVIRVKAIDKAGNERIAARIPDESLRTEIKEPVDKAVFLIIGGVVLLILLFGLFFLMYRKMKKKKEVARDTIINNEEEVSIDEEISQEPQTENTNEGNEFDENNQNTSN